MRPMVSAKRPQTKQRSHTLLRTPACCDSERRIRLKHSSGVKPPLDGPNECGGDLDNGDVELEDDSFHWSTSAEDESKSSIPSAPV